MIKKIIQLVLFTALSSSTLFAQKEIAKGSIQNLPEVIIKSKRVVHHTNYDVYIPSQQQQEHAANGLDLLSLVRLPRIRVDQVEKSVSTLISGEVQVRINGILSSVEEVQALIPSQIIKIDYITNPGLKYGKGISCVINIKIKRNNQGLAWGVNTMNALTTNYHDDSGWIKFTNKLSEFGLRYNFRLNSNEDVKTKSNQRFVEKANVIRNVAAEGKYNNSHYDSHNLTLSYNVANTKNRVFDVKFSMGWSGFPDRTLSEQVIDNDAAYEIVTSKKSEQSYPTLKLYYADKLDKKNSFSVYVATAYINSEYKRGIHLPTLQNLYDVSGEKYSAKTELNFTHSLSQTAQLNIGYQQTGAYTKNEYSSSSDSRYTMHNDSQYLYGEYSVKFKKLGMHIGLGESRDYFKSSDGDYTFWSFRPNVNIKYELSDKSTMSYKYNRETTLPSLAQLSDFVRYDNTYEAVVGNVNLEPYNTDYNEFRINYDLGSTYFSLVGNYNYSHQMICDSPVILDQGVYYYSYGNETNKHHVQLSFYGDHYFWGNKLLVYVMPYFTRDIIEGEYHHSNSVWCFKVGGSLYLGKYTVDFDYDSPSERLMGETVYHNYSTTNLSFAYKRKGLSLKCGVRNLFNPSGSGVKLKRLSDIAYSTSDTRNQAFGNMIYASISWNMSIGKKNKRISVKTSNSSMDTGIVK